jgi:hypothetical protein
MKFRLITALVCLSTVTLFSCSNDLKKVKYVQAKPSAEAQKQLKIYHEGVLIDIDFAKWVNTELHKNPDLTYSLIGNNNVYSQIAKACILSGDLTFKEVLAPHIYKFEPTKQTKACLMREVKKPISYKLLSQSFLVPLGNKKDMELEMKLNQIYEQADKMGIFTVEDYLNIASLIQGETNELINERIDKDLAEKKEPA